MKRILPVLIILASLFLLIFNLTGNNRGRIFSTGTTSLNGKQMLKVISHEEKYCFRHCGAIQVFHAYRDGNWQEITDFRDDKPIAFSGRNVITKNEDFAYFWVGWKFGVTTDGGKTWLIWSAENNELMREAANYDLIENVIIESDGRGKMFFNSTGKDRSGISWLKTEDYGKTWHR